MSLTPEQLAFETANLETQHKAVQASDLEAMMTFFKDDAIFTDRHGVQTGAPALRAYLEKTWGGVEKYTVNVTARTFDPAQNLIWESSEDTIVLKDDPEKKVLKIRGLSMVKKTLGTGEKKVDAIVHYSDDGDVMKRVQELMGIKIGA